jgi:preprotein translocase subunit SecA
MEDSLMRIFASDRIRGIMQSIGLEDGEAIEHRMVNNAIEKAQRKVEGHNFDIRKNLLEFDDVSNDQRQVTYQQRRDLMLAEDISSTIEGLREEVVLNVVAEYIPPQSIEEQWDIEGLEQALQAEFASRQPLPRWLDEDDTLDEDSLARKILAQADAEYAAKEQDWADHNIDMRQVEKQIMLQILDQRWKEHLATMDHLRQGIHLRAYAQKQPKQEYKREAFEMFGVMLDQVKHDTISILSRIRIRGEDDLNEMSERKQPAGAMKFQHAEASALGGQQQSGQPPSAPQAPVEQFVRDGRKIGRNEPCPCGSGKKFKQCHGRLNA